MQGGLGHSELAAFLKFLKKKKKNDPLAFLFKGLERGFGESISPRGSPGMAVNLANLLGITQKSNLFPSKTRKLSGADPRLPARVAAQGRSRSPARVCLGNNYLPSFESKTVPRALCRHGDQIQWTVSKDSLPFRKLFADNAAGPDSASLQELLFALRGSQLGRSSLCS